jgi:ribosomal protein S12 methylthiotransferase accessory factor
LAPVLGWVNERFGPIQRLSPLLLERPLPRWWFYTCDLSRLPPGTWFSAHRTSAGGASVDPDQALRRALGEAVERYCVSTPADPRDCFPLAPRENPILGLFPSCAPDEPLFSPIDPDTPATHVEARRLADDRKEAVPATCVYPFFTPATSEPLLTAHAVSGFAFHTELHSALWHGLCEVAERDAILLTWWSRRRVRSIACAPSDIPNELAERIDRIQRVGLTPLLFDVGVDFPVPTVLCVLLGDEYPFATAGGACTTDPVAACAKAIDEAVYVRAGFHANPPKEPLLATDDFGWVDTLEAHGRLYAMWERAPAFRFLLESGLSPITIEEISSRDAWQPPNTMEDLVQRCRTLEEMGFTPLWVDRTIPEAREFGHVVVVIVPEMLPLPQHHSARWLASRRLLRFAKVAKPRADLFNPYPEPLA